MLRNSASYNSNNEQAKHYLRIVQSPIPRKRERIVVKRGLEFILLRLEDVVLLYTENKIVYVADKDGKKYMAEQNLSELITSLDETVFFRANRQYIVNIAFIKSFKSYEKVKLQLALTTPELSHHFIIISQEMAPQFRKWIGGE
jgi:DNA-binding LytR/AlgR family response regulator